MSSRQYVTPLIIHASGEVTRLVRTPTDDQTYNERWFQDKLFEHPELLPSGEIESAFRDLVAVAKELPIEGNSADLLFVNADGQIAIIETKLFRNAESRREVISQAIEYASILAGWGYSQLVEAVRLATKGTDQDPLLGVMRRSVGAFDESRFVERVERNLQLGRILLLIVGDEIRDQAQRMVDFIHRTPHLHFTLGLIEMALFKDNETGHLLLQPRIVAQTKLETRTVIEIKLPEGAQLQAHITPVQSTAIRARSISEEQFYEELRQESPEAADLVKWAVEQAPAHELVIDWKAGGPILRYRDERTREEFSFGQLYRYGHFDPIYWLPKFRKLQLPEAIATDYLDDITRLVPGSYRQQRPFENELKSEVVLYPEGSQRLLPLAALAPHKEKWFEAIDKAIRRLKECSGKERDA